MEPSARGKCLGKLDAMVEVHVRSPLCHTQLSTLKKYCKLNSSQYRLLRNFLVLIAVLRLIFVFLIAVLRCSYLSPFWNLPSHSKVLPTSLQSTALSSAATQSPIKNFLSLLLWNLSFYQIFYTLKQRLCFCLRFSNFRCYSVEATKKQLSVWSMCQ